jgi:ferredoxin
MIHIDTEKCTRCLRCVTECPTKCLAIENDTVIRVASAVCLACGHCISVCSSDAISWRSEDGRSPFSIAGFDDDDSNVPGVFRRTRSVRVFKPVKLDKTLIRKLVRDAEAAPSPDNFRNREYIVVDNTDTVFEMEVLLIKAFKKNVHLLHPLVIRALSIYSASLASELAFVVSLSKSIENRQLEREHVFFRDAPCVIFITGPKQSLFAKDECVAAQNYMRLSAMSSGVGSCIVGPAQESKGVIEKFLCVDRDRKIYAATIFGYQQNEFRKRISYPDPSITWVV